LRHIGDDAPHADPTKPRIENVRGFFTCAYAATAFEMAVEDPRGGGAKREMQIVRVT
jgi:hypothetical protein